MRLNFFSIRRGSDCLWSIFCVKQLYLIPCLNLFTFFCTFIFYWYLIYFILLIMRNPLITFTFLAHIFLLSLTQGNACSSNTFQIVGNGQVSVNPDIIRLSITATGEGANASIALSNLNIKINEILKAITKAKIPSSNYSTAGININPVYNYQTTPVTTTGYLANQELRLTLGNIDFLNTLTTNVNVTISSLVYDLFDKRNAYKLARTAAFKDAQSKYNQYLSLTSFQDGGLKIINDLNSQLYTPYESSSNLYYLYKSLITPPAASPVKITASVKATWKVKG